MDCVFIHIAKTGGLSIQKVLCLKPLRFRHRTRFFKQSGRVTFGHLDYRKLLRKGVVGEEFHRRAFKFAFCRNPFDRAVSQFFYTKRKHKDIVNDETTFLDFTRDIGKYGKVFRQQFTYIDGIDMDFIGRFENLENDIRFVGDKIGVKVDKIPRINSTNHDYYKNYYCEESIRNVAEFYEKDFSIFNYEVSL